MKKTINRKVYNTDTATAVKTNTVSYFGDPAGYEETLYKTSRGDYFVYGIGGEESKSGISPQELPELLEQAAALPNIHICGLMTIPPPSQSTVYLEAMQKLFADCKANPVPNTEMRILSMGMSGDFEAAIACGSNLVRIGSALFGARKYV